MADTLLERIWAWIHQTFPERQIYIRSDGRVQFFTFGPSLQATLAGLSLIFLGWIAFATVNVIFKDRIIAAKDHRFQQMQSAYENRLADLQISYDELNGALVGAEDKFKATADELSTKQKAISGFLTRKSQIEASIGAGRSANPPLGAISDGSAASDSLDFVTSSTGAEGGTGANGGMGAAAVAPSDADMGASLSMMPGPVPPQSRTAKPADKASMLDRAWTHIGQLARAVFAKPRRNAAPMSAAYAQHPALRALSAQVARLERIGADETQLMVRTEDQLKTEIGVLRETVHRTGINPDALARKMVAGEGGPEIPLDSVRVNGISDAGFNASYLRAAAVMDQLNGLSSQMRHIPLSIPVSVVGQTSGFGSRVDPFTGRYAFHPGIDFAGAWGSHVTATAPGIVVFAGYKGSYGNMVEIDHGFGLHTRYGHLSSIEVRPGMRIAKGDGVGRMGSTGRSTGPHVHYEIWFDDVLRNPSNFIEAGRHVL